VFLSLSLEGEGRVTVCNVRGSSHASNPLSLILSPTGRGEMQAKL
jgi:hypothetical protein